METKAQQEYSVDQFRDIGNQLSSQYGPMFQKYLEKAMQHAQPQKIEQAPIDPTPDPNTYLIYIQSVQKAKDVAAFSQKSNAIIQKMYNAQVKMIEEFNRLRTILGNLQPYGNPSTKMLLLNEDSTDMVNDMNESVAKLDQFVSEIVTIAEEGFDNIGPFGLK